LLQRRHDAQGAALEIDVRPAQCKQFTLAQTGGNGDAVQRLEWIAGGRLKDLAPAPGRAPSSGTPPPR
jgi:hypothetical protein